jgi:diguanylate cyclase (GGDEF)-like protein
MDLASSARQLGPRAGIFGAPSGGAAAASAAVDSGGYSGFVCAHICRGGPGAYDEWGAFHESPPGEKRRRMAGAEFGEELGMALNKAILFSQMEMHSRVDGLTGLLRRQPFMDRLAEELKKAKAFNTPFCVLMVDIDHFKAVNDSHGHGAGDIVLGRIGQLLKEAFYETDVVGRYGGEEFIVLLPRAHLDGVLRKAEAMRKRIEAELIVCGFTQLKVTVSIGVARYPDHGLTGEDVIAGADRALYQAKESGRNRVTAA